MKSQPISLKELVKLEELSSLLNETYKEFNVLVQVEALKADSSKKGNSYQKVLIKDDTGKKILLNFTDFTLELFEKYNLKIRGKKDKYSLTLFLIEAKAIELDGDKNFAPYTLNPSKEWFGEVTNLNLKVKNVSGSKINDLDLAFEGDYLVVFEDKEENVYYLRVWPNNMIDRSEFSVGSIWSLKNIMMFKKASDNSRNLSFNSFTQLDLLSEA